MLLLKYSRPKHPKVLANFLNTYLEITSVNAWVGS